MTELEPEIEAVELKRVNPIKAEDLRIARLKLGLSQQNLAQIVGVSPTTIYRWEKGGIMSDLSLIKLSKALKYAKEKQAPKPKYPTKPEVFHARTQSLPVAE